MFNIQYAVLPYCIGKYMYANPTVSCSIFYMPYCHIAYKNGCILCEAGLQSLQSVVQYSICRVAILHIKYMYSMPSRCANPTHSCSIFNMPYCHIALENTCMQTLQSVVQYSICRIAILHINMEVFYAKHVCHPYNQFFTILYAALLIFT